ncbi:MAG: hypothetical protein R6W70_04530 [bacterium]
MGNLKRRNKKEEEFIKEAEKETSDVKEKELDLRDDIKRATTLSLGNNLFNTFRDVVGYKKSSYIVQDLMKKYLKKEGYKIIE